jgi:ABC-2 type transport system permease protein
LAYVAIWLAIYSGTTSIAGVSLAQMVTYSLLSGLVAGAIRYESIIGGIGRGLNTGDVAVWLLKPASFPLYVLASELGRAAFRLVFHMVPTVAVVALIYGMLPPATLLDGLMFVPYLLLGFAIVALISALFGLIAFWLLTSFSLEWMFQAILNLLSGMAIPFWFFPQPFGTVAAWLPFAWIAYYPCAVWLGRLTPGETLLLFVVGLAWAAALALGVAVLWGKASRRIVVQGG